MRSIRECQPGWREKAGSAGQHLSVSAHYKLIHSTSSVFSLDFRMIHSMTAFARESAATDQGVLTVELRSVNHRYLDCTFKLPDSLRPL